MMADDDKMTPDRKSALVKAGFAAGIGSAAIAAALLYASRSRAKKPKMPKGNPPPTD
ncbi:MAG: isopropylmalate isomerase [Sphingomicrobium sp.]